MRSWCLVLWRFNFEILLKTSPQCSHWMNFCNSQLHCFTDVNSSAKQPQGYHSNPLPSTIQTPSTPSRRGWVESGHGCPRLSLSPYYGEVSLSGTDVDGLDADPCSKVHMTWKERAKQQGKGLLIPNIQKVAVTWAPCLLSLFLVPMQKHYTVHLKRQGEHQRWRHRN